MSEVLQLSTYVFHDAFYVITFDQAHRRKRHASSTKAREYLVDVNYRRGQLYGFAND